MAAKGSMASFIMCTHPGTATTARLTHVLLPNYLAQYRTYSTSATSSGSSSAIATPDPRWLSSMKARLGYCITFGINEAQTLRAGAILKELTTDWRDFLAGGEGFLTQKGRRGLWRHEIFWGHVNNVKFNRWAESGRVQWTRNFAKADVEHCSQWSELDTPKGEGMILRSIRTDYKFPMMFPDRVTVLHKLHSEPKAGMDAFILDVLILSERHQRPAARCVEDIVMYDYRVGKKCSLPLFMLAKFKETFQLQEAARAKYTARAQEITRLVEQLENESWNRPDAAEDLGSASS
ncbi:hypothetical protein EJ05DRAFT_500644 [Pseudovirgaria hyperparasitica]|uniref:Thioesterase/thiol ester dehydrase-isomerase n=1 Tax=Pseudovirgaria hyperparasitica TaxID=470096 RepID=A0A6A6W6F5_9PEZI|nr:uncharacterized protein EJ05DRAFT_500644 [Pseudovirgaria hyperparasitica]KAF2758125.1 hypothetical protein EJ05DRAFT_500644 [Pseudovirgaria hyperparasitica]